MADLQWRLKLIINKLLLLLLKIYELYCACAVRHFTAAQTPPSSTISLAWSTIEYQ